MLQLSSLHSNNSATRKFTNVSCGEIREFYRSPLHFPSSLLARNNRHNMIVGVPTWAFLVLDPVRVPSTFFAIPFPLTLVELLYQLNQVINKPWILAPRVGFVRARRWVDTGAGPVALVLLRVALVPVVDLVPTVLVPAGCVRRYIKDGFLVTVVLRVACARRVVKGMLIYMTWDKI